MRSLGPAGERMRETRSRSWSCRLEGSANACWARERVARSVAEIEYQILLDDGGPTSGISQHVSASGAVRLEDRFCGVEVCWFHRRGAGDPDKGRPLKERPIKTVAVGTNAAAMCFDSGATDCQAQAQAGVLGREEAIEKTREMLRANTRTAVLDSAAHDVRVLEHRSDGNAVIGSLKLRCCLKRIDDQIDNHLLELSAVAGVLWKPTCHIEGHDDSLQLQLMTKEAQ
jgi:hypothetical protein